MPTLLAVSVAVLLAAALVGGGRAAFVLIREAMDTRRIERGRELGLMAARLEHDRDALDAQARLQSRKLDLEERALIAQEQRQRNPAVPVAIPSDLYRRITRWGSSDAQNDERTTLLDLYNEFRDAGDPWAEVRAHLPTEPDDRASDTIYAGGPVS